MAADQLSPQVTLQNSSVDSGYLTLYKVTRVSWDYQVSRSD